VKGKKEEDADDKEKPKARCWWLTPVILGYLGG
jgi:hypothetical protein